MHVTVTRNQKHLPTLIDPMGQEHPLSAPEVTVGRAVENDIVITSKRVSRSHARLWREGRHVMLADLNSTNGTFLDGERVMRPISLRDGDCITIGDMELIFRDPEATVNATPFPELVLDEATGEVWVDRRLVSLSAKEYALLRFLYAHRGEICSKDAIGQAVWPENKGIVYDYQIESLVRRLRVRIEPEPNEPQLVVTVRGLGYKMGQIARMANNS